jgi:hypothetical protein
MIQMRILMASDKEEGDLVVLSLLVMQQSGRQQNLNPNQHERDVLCRNPK